MCLSNVELVRVQFHLFDDRVMPRISLLDGSHRELSISTYVIALFVKKFALINVCKSGTLDKIIYGEVGEYVCGVCVEAILFYETGCVCVLNPKTKSCCEVKVL